MRMKLNEKTYKIWDDYIKEYAPADSALRLVVHLANLHAYANRAAVARKVYSLYYHLFPKSSMFFEEQMDKLEEIMLAQIPQEDMVYIYDEYIREKAPDDYSIVAIKRLIEPFIERKSWDTAAAVLKGYLPIFKDKDEKLLEMIGIIESPEEEIIVNNLGNIINTRSSEWDPTPTPDGKYLYFSSRQMRNTFGGTDIYVSEFIDGEWQRPENIGRSLNGNNDETIDNVTVDGTTLMLSGTFDGTFGNFDIFLAHKLEDGWSSLEQLPMPVNSKYTDESANFTPDGKAIIFSSDRPDGIGDFVPFGSLHHGSTMGNMDIYISYKSDSGWSDPVNLGETINTHFSERAPFLHPDGRTLYFSSDGHPGLGGLDVFKSYRLKEDSWTEWSKPVNLGKEINTASDDWGYVVSLSGDSAFFAGFDRTDGYGGWDIYSVTLPQSAKPQRVVTIKGQVKSTSGTPLNAIIKWEDLETGKEIGTLRSDPKTGDYIIVLNYGKNYGFFAEKEGYISTSDNIDLREIPKDSIINIDIFLPPIYELKDQKISIIANNIFFDYNDFNLKRESYPELDRLISFMNKYPEVEIEVHGHTDNIGSSKFNMDLSMKRAKQVKEYLISNGCNPEKIMTKGHGFENPVADNDSDEGREKNRRVEIIFSVSID
jgi:outer membrane protein OmpA-like peptidoglycan-associated protein